MSSPRVPGSRGLLVVGVVLVALNLRLGLAAVGPLVAAVREDTGLSNGAIGLLTTLPLIAFGVVSPLTAFLTRRIGVEGSVVLALALIMSGSLVRALPSVPLLFAGTAVLGIGVALGNVLLPAIAKRDFGDRSGPMTSLYSSAMGVGATLAAGASAPLALTLGWRGSLAAWSAPAALALLAWLPLARPSRRGPVTEGRGTSFRRLGRSPLAWHVALFMGFQSLTFYVILAWLPDLLQARGMSATAAGGLLALSQATGVAGTALIPLWAGKLADQRRIVWTLGALEALALAGLLLPGGALAGVWVGLIGFVLGGTFGLALLLLVLRSPDATTAAELSGMAQSVGYTIAAAGPALFGLLHDLADGWTVPLAFLFAVLAAKLAVGASAARAGTVRTRG